jgi:hypothetical protein
MELVIILLDEVQPPRFAWFLVGVLKKNRKLKMLAGFTNRKKLKKANYFQRYGRKIIK